MIYLSRHFDSGGSLFRIGHISDDIDVEKFISDYSVYDPGCEFLYFLPGGSRLHKSELHNRFREYLISGTKWFKDVKEIEDYFRNLLRGFFTEET